MSPSEIKRVRDVYLLSQTSFGHLVGVAFTTENRWEQGRNVPTGPALVILEALRKIALDGNAHELLAELDHFSIEMGSGEAYLVVFSMAYGRRA
jgi:transcriptional regulator with XRE-family HTH domain